jgi:TDG/mug DNA glycosylase family protein
VWVASPIVGYTKEQLRLCEGARVPDLIGPHCRLLFVGINPGLWTAATGIHFAHPSNRFYPALLRAGIIGEPVDVDPPAPFVQLAETRSDGLDPGRRSMVEHGVGITNLVARATARASELSADELRSGAGRLEQTVERVRPAVVAIAGVTAYRTAFRRPGATLGRQEVDLAGVEVWAVPNPSGLNAHETVDTLAEQYAEAARRAGVLS